MDQETTAEGGGGFVPRPLFGDTARPEPAETTHAEPAGRQEPSAAPPEAGETGESSERASQATDGRPRDPATGKFVPKVESAPEGTGSPPAQPQSEPPQHVPVAVLVEERKRRQALERELAEFQRRIAASQPPMQPQAPQAPQVPLHDLMYQEPERFVQTLQEQQQEALMQTRLALSEAVAKQQPDYAAAEDALTAYARSSPMAAREVAQALRTHPAPAIWAYQAGKELLARQRWQSVIQQHGDPEAFINAEVERRLAERVQQPAAPTASPTLPPASLASARSVGSRGNASTFTGPRPLFPPGRRA